MTTTNFSFNRYHYFDRKFYLTGTLFVSLLLLTMLGIEFRYQYLHNPAVHIFFQSKGIYLF